MSEAQTETQETTQAEQTPPPQGEAPPPQSSETPPVDEKPTTVVNGAGEDKEPENKPYWPEDWREKMARYAAGEDEKAYKKELRRLERITDPAGMYGSYRELDNRLNGGGLIKMPGDGASEDEIKRFQEALGWKEDAAELVKDIKLENDATFGEADKPVVQSFVEAINGATSAQDVVNRAANWYFASQEKQMAELDDADEAFKRESVKELKEDLGPAYNRTLNSVASLFASAPGGSDISNENSVYYQLLHARLPSGRLAGDHPDVIRALAAWSREINPEASVVEDAGGGVQSIKSEMAKIEEIMRTNRREYNAKYADRYAELLAADQRIQARHKA